MGFIMDLLNDACRTVNKELERMEDTIDERELRDWPDKKLASRAKATSDIRFKMACCKVLQERGYDSESLNALMHQ